MKKTNILTLILCIYLFSCSKNEEPDPPPTPESYMNVNVGSKWNYEVIDNAPPPSTSLYSLTSTNRDSTINGNQFHVYTNSTNGINEYYRISGTDYYTYRSLPAALGGTKVENLYLKTGVAVGTTWNQLYNVTYNSFPLAVTVTHKIEEKGISRTVNGTAYNNVIHIKTNITVAGISASELTTDIHYYYAPNYGMIENSSKININYFTIVSSSDVLTKLVSAALL